MKEPYGVLVVKRRLSGLLLSALLLVSACADSKGTPQSDAADRLDGTFATVGGESIDLGSLEGQDVVLWFWAPW